jgi:hypothetical protein
MQNKVAKMEVRLSEFADILGTTQHAIRSAIAKPDDLPFDDREFRVSKDAERVSRRKYSVADAFAWFLSDEMPIAIGVNGRRMSMHVRRSWGLPDFVESRMRDFPNMPASGKLLIVWSKPSWTESADGAQRYPDYRFGSEIGTEDRLRELKHPIKFSIDLDAMFDRFVRICRMRGWAVSAEGFSRLHAFPEGDQQ